MQEYLKDIQALETLIKKDRGLQKYLKIRKNERPNYWYILYHQGSKEKMVAYESSYSKVLRWLLDPYENHGLAHRFAEGILSYIHEEAIKMIESSQVDVKTEWERIDVLYENLASKDVIAIEVKQYSEEVDHSEGEVFRSQLDTYEEKLKKHYALDYRLTMIYLTALGDQSKSKTAAKTWIPMSYEDLIQILDQLMEDMDSKLEDSYRILRDFRNDLFRTSFLLSCAEEKKYLKERLKDHQVSIERLWYLLHTEDTHLLKKKAALKDDLSFEVKETVLLLKEAMSVQDHTPNEAVQYIIREVFNEYADRKILVDDPDRFGEESKEERVAKLNTKGKEIFKGFQYIRLSGGKGQGVFICNKNPLQTSRKERIEIYFSGDAKGVLPNDGLQKIRFEKEIEIVERVKMSSYTVEDLFGKSWESKEFQLKEQVFFQLMKEIEEKFMQILKD